MKHHNKKRNPCASCMLPDEYKSTLMCSSFQLHNAFQDLKLAVVSSFKMKNEAVHYECPFNELRKEMKKRLLYGDPDSHPKGMV